jgi:hypothetical protein
VPQGLPFGGMPASRRRHLIMACSVGLLLVLLSGMALYEKLLRKQQVTVPKERAEEILRGHDLPPAAAPAPAGTRAAAATAPSR